MIIVDTSVWVAYFNGQTTPQTETLEGLLGTEAVGIGDLILAEILAGFRSDRDFRTARSHLQSLATFEMLGVDSALRSAENYRTLRKRGCTVRKMADVIIATFCIHERHVLLHADRDFEPFVRYLGLDVV